MLAGMDLGVHYVSFSHPGGPETVGPRVADTARTAESLGCSDFTVMDHWFQMERPFSAEDPMLEGYSTLAFLAGQTDRITLGLLVTGVTYRHPGLLAKTVTTLDVLSGGRARLGLGAAWYEREHRALGVTFPPLAERFERLEETLQICLQMWSDDDGPYAGRHYRLAETLCVPQPVQQPRPPILLGGSGERKTLRLVARYADATNLYALPPAELRHKLDVLDGHCETEGRDPAEVERTVLAGGVRELDVDEFLGRMEAYAALGITKVWVTPQGPDPVGWVERFGESVLPRLREL
jgi:F420-dependent oxidoreductase-like protein